MTYTLYGRRQTGSLLIEAALALTGADFRLVEVAKDLNEGDLAAFRRINPRGQVPVLVHPDGTVITECAAILAHLADSHPKAAMVPPPGSSARARHDRWMAFMHANLYEAMLREAYSDRYTTDPQGTKAVADAATGYIRQHFQIIESELEASATNWPFGAGISMADCFLWLLCLWADADWLAAQCPVLTAHWQRMRALPALAAIEARHFA